MSRPSWLNNKHSSLYCLSVCFALGFGGQGTIDQFCVFTAANSFDDYFAVCRLLPFSILVSNRAQGYVA